MVLLGVVVTMLVGSSGCEKDTDCKGDRICERGQCVSPQPGAVAPGEGPPPAPPPEAQRRTPLGVTAPCRSPEDSRSPLGTPPCPSSADTELVPPPLPPPQAQRVPLGGPATSHPQPTVDPCDEPLQADGRLKPECRVAPTSDAPRSRKKRRARIDDTDAGEEPVARPVGLLGVMYGGLFGGGSGVPIFAFAGAAGVRFRSGVGLVAVAHGRIFVGSAGTIQLYGLGPGLRLGNRSQLTLALTGTFAAIDVGAIRVSGGGLFSVLAQGAIVLGDHFTLLVQPTIDFDASGVVGSVTGGLGITF